MRGYEGRWHFWQEDEEGRWLGFLEDKEGGAAGVAVGRKTPEDAFGQFGNEIRPEQRRIHAGVHERAAETLHLPDDFIRPDNINGVRIVDERLRESVRLFDNEKGRRAGRFLSAVHPRF